MGEEHGDLDAEFISRLCRSSPRPMPLALAYNLRRSATSGSRLPFAGLVFADHRNGRSSVQLDVDITRTAPIYGEETRSLLRAMPEIVVPDKLCFAQIERN